MFFDLFILIGNPSADEAAVTITYLLPDGTTIGRTTRSPAKAA